MLSGRKATISFINYYKNFKKVVSPKKPHIIDPEKKKMIDAKNKRKQKTLKKKPRRLHRLSDGSNF